MYITLENIRGEYRNIIVDAQQESPVDIEQIAARYDLPIECGEIEDIPGEKTRDGELCRTSNGNYVIRTHKKLEGAEYLNYKRYTIAHEIAHYILHGHLLKAGECFERGLRDEWEDYRESEANRLAADILMPTDLMKKIVNRQAGELTIADLANKMQVSEQDLKIRLNI